MLYTGAPTSRERKKVCVLVTTYNHEQFIAEALNSVLMQEVTFDYEVTIIEDCSTDRTRDIVVEFQKNYPDKIHLVLAERNQNDNTAWAREIPMAESEYIALLDGDDYWTSPHKLQRQVDFLDQHKECSTSFHQAYCSFPDGSRLLYSENFGYEFSKSVYTLEDVIFQNFLPTCSVVFRKGLFGEFPGCFYDMPSADWFLNVLNAERGAIGYIDEIWGVRRVHPGGVISMKSPREKLVFNIKCIEMINKYFHFRYKKQANEKLLAYHYQLAELFAQERDFDNASVHAKRCLQIAPFKATGVSRTFLFAAAMSRVPMFARLFEHLLKDHFA